MRHSASSLETWTNCPRLWKAKYVEKIVPYVENPAAARGTEIHSTLEQAVKIGTPPISVWTPPNLIESLHRQGAELERRMAVDGDGKPTGFDSDDVKLRGVMDVYLPTSNRALVIDWKTGKVRPKKLQADAYTVFGKALLGQDADIVFRFVYVDQRQTVPLDRDDRSFERIFDLIAQVEADTEHLPQPGWLCRFCDFYACRYNENPAKYARERNHDG